MVELALPAAGVFVSGFAPEIVTALPVLVPPARTYRVRLARRRYVLLRARRRYTVRPEG
jgi:hypothetical protein